MICKVCSNRDNPVYASRNWFDYENSYCSEECANSERILVIDLKFNENLNNRLWEKKYFYNRLECDEYFESHPRPNDLIIKVGVGEE